MTEKFSIPNLESYVARDDPLLSEINKESKEILYNFITHPHERPYLAAELPYLTSSILRLEGVLSSKDSEPNVIEDALKSVRFALTKRELGEVVPIRCCAD